MQRIVPKFVPITPYELYLQRVNSTYDNLRKQANGFSYIPAQFGGFFGQEVAANSGIVLELTDFEVE